MMLNSYCGTHPTCWSYTSPSNNDPQLRYSASPMLYLIFSAASSFSRLSMSILSACFAG